MTGGKSEVTTMHHRIGSTVHSARLLAATIAIVVVGIGSGCAGSDPEAEALEAFCGIAETSENERSQDEVDAYYAELEQVAPEVIREDVAILRSGWAQVSIPFETAAMGDLGSGDVTRSPEIGTAARSVSDYVHDQCGFDGGVYLIFPEAGW
jgi:hypothetical protein